MISKLNREQFKSLVFKRDCYKCIICHDIAIDAHHIIERKLWPNGGYYLENGISLCGQCHIYAEQSIISCEELREAAKIINYPLPPGINHDTMVDKWGVTIMNDLKKYPRTRHLQGSRKSGDDFELEDVSFETALQGKFVVYEYKIDGSNTGLSFSNNKELLIQSRGHYLRGGPREKEFTKVKEWATALQNDLCDVLGKRYIMYGESMYAKHTIYYDALPHYFLEFDVYDKEKKLFLSTKARKSLLEGLSYVAAPIAFEGIATTLEHLKSFIGFSVYKTKDWKQNLIDTANKIHQNVELVLAQTDSSDLEEGIYIKVETEEETVDRFKFVRSSFTNSILNQGSHWNSRPILPNKLADGVNLYV